MIYFQNGASGRICIHVTMTNFSKLLEVTSTSKEGKSALLRRALK
jgi:hypothetical protein